MFGKAQARRNLLCPGNLIKIVGDGRLHNAQRILTPVMNIYVELAYKQFLRFFRKITYILYGKCYPGLKCFMKVNTHGLYKLIFQKSSVRPFGLTRYTNNQ